MKYTTPNQFAGMLERRATDLDDIANRMRSAQLPGWSESFEAALKLRDAAKRLRVVGSRV